MRKSTFVQPGRRSDTTRCADSIASTSAVPIFACEFDVCRAACNRSRQRRRIPPAPAAGRSKNAQIRWPGRAPSCGRLQPASTSKTIAAATLQMSQDIDADEIERVLRAAKETLDKGKDLRSCAPSGLCSLCNCVPMSDTVQHLTHACFHLCTHAFAIFQCEHLSMARSSDRVQMHRPRLRPSASLRRVRRCPWQRCASNVSSSNSSNRLPTRRRNRRSRRHLWPPRIATPSCSVYRSHCHNNRSVLCLEWRMVTRDVLPLMLIVVLGFLRFSLFFRHTSSLLMMFVAPNQTIVAVSKRL
jgi:hypothetical protein